MNQIIITVPITWIYLSLLHFTAVCKYSCSLCQWYVMQLVFFHRRRENLYFYESSTERLKKIKNHQRRLVKVRPVSTRGRTQRHAVGAKVRVFVRNPDELTNERAELARLLNKAGTCFLHELSLSTTSEHFHPDSNWYDSPCIVYLVAPRCSMLTSLKSEYHESMIVPPNSFDRRGSSAVSSAWK